MPKQGVILWGILAGLAYGVILFVLDGIAGSGFSVVGSKGLMILLAAAGGGVGGILGINMKRDKTIFKNNNVCYNGTVFINFVFKEGLYRMKHIKH